MKHLSTPARVKGHKKGRQFDGTSILKQIGNLCFYFGTILTNRMKDSSFERISIDDRRL